MSITVEDLKKRCATLDARLSRKQRRGRGAQPIYAQVGPNYGDTIVVPVGLGLKFFYAPQGFEIALSEVAAWIDSLTNAIDDANAEYESWDLGYCAGREHA